MAAQKAILGGYLGTFVVSDASVNATGQDNVTGAASTVFGLQIDNTANAGAMVFFKLYDTANATVGTTVADYVIPVQGGKKLVYTMASGLQFSAGISYGCTTSAATASTASPSAAVKLVLLAD